MLKFGAGLQPAISPGLQMSKPLAEHEGYFSKFLAPECEFMSRLSWQT